MSRAGDIIWTFKYRFIVKHVSINDWHPREKGKEINNVRNEKWWCLKIKRRNNEAYFQAGVEFEAAWKENRLIYSRQNNWWRYIWKSQNWYPYYHVGQSRRQNPWEKQNCRCSWLRKGFQRNSHIEDCVASVSCVALWNYWDA